MTPDITWQIIREVLQTLSLLRGGLVVRKNDGEGKKVRSLLVAMWLAGLVTWAERSSDYWVFKITDDGWAARFRRPQVNRGYQQSFWSAFIEGNAAVSNTGKSPARRPRRATCWVQGEIRRI